MRGYPQIWKSFRWSAAAFAYLATMKMQFPTQGFLFSYSDTYAQGCCNGIARGLSESDAIQEEADAQLQQFASNLIICLIEISGGLSVP